MERRGSKINVATDLRWDTDPSPSYDETAARIGVALPPPTSPDRPANDVEWQIAAFWPAVGPHRGTDG